MTEGGMEGEDVAVANCAGRLARCESTTLEEERSGACTVGAFDSELEGAGASTGITADELSSEPRLLTESCCLEVVGTKLVGMGGTGGPASTTTVLEANVETRESGEVVLGSSGGTGLREKDCFRTR